MSDELKKIKEEYLEYVSPILDEIEVLIIGLTRMDKGRLRAVKNHIHSIKGTGGSLGFRETVKVCHNFEDFLEDINLEENFSTKNIKKSLKFLDLVRVSLSESKSIKSVIDLGLSDVMFGADLNSSSHKVLIVDSSNSLIRVVKATLTKLGAQCSYAKDALSALERVINEEFDSVICSRKLPLIDAVELFNIMKIVKLKNKCIKKIIVTSDSMDDYEDSDVKIFKKDNLFFEKIADEYKNILNKSEENQKKSSLNFPLNNVLILDDELTMLKIIGSIIQKNIKVEKCFQALSIEEAVKISETVKLDLIIADYNLSEETIVDLLNRSGFSNIPFIIISASPKENLELNDSAQIIGFIQKPIQLNLFIKSVVDSWNSFKIKYIDN